MLKLGTHNSLSYLPCQWYMIPFNWIGKCQSLSLKDQYKKGVRYFDIRLKYKDKLKYPISGHGLLTYNVNIYDILSELNTYGDLIYVRLFLENSKNNPEKYRDRFKSDIDTFIGMFDNLVFLEGGSRYNYIRLIDNDPISTLDCYARYDKMKFCIPYPKGWAKKNNKSYHKTDNEITFNIYDYIQY